MTEYSSVTQINAEAFEKNSENKILYNIYLVFLTFLLEKQTSNIVTNGYILNGSKDTELWIEKVKIHIFILLTFLLVYIY